MNRENLIRAVAVTLATAGLAGCSHYSGVVTREDRRLWVIGNGPGNNEVYRCADATEGNQPPRPLCVRAPMVDAK